MPPKFKSIKALLFLVPLLILCSNCGDSWKEEVSRKGKQPPKSQKTGPASTAATAQSGDLQFAESYFDAGKVIQGAKVEKNFSYRNNGAVPVAVKEVKTACGCTTTDMAKKVINPGEEGTFTMIVDTADKRGSIIKTADLFLEGNKESPVSVAVAMTVELPKHPVSRDRMDVLAKKECRSCHLDAGKGKTGVRLYHLVCFQCHGVKGKGGMAKALREKKWLDSVSDAFLKKTISKGNAESGMPGYAAKAGGDGLTEEQIQSLVEYIRSWSLPSAEPVSDEQPAETT